MRDVNGILPCEGTMPSILLLNKRQHLEAFPVHHRDYDHCCESMVVI
jgi:hypothetical protein